MRGITTIGISLTVVFAAAWLGADGNKTMGDKNIWNKVTSGVYRLEGSPTAYALVDGDKALVMGAPRQFDLNLLKPIGVTSVDLVLLTHHHRDSTASAATLVKEGVEVRAPKKSADWLTVKGVAAFWEIAMPELIPGKTPGLRDRSFGIFDYLVHPVGIDGIDCSLTDGDKIEWRDWTLEVIETPGHSRDHVSFVARKKDADNTELPIVFCGDAICADEKLWSPYTTDWHHCFDDGLQSAATSLRKMASLKPAILCPEHGLPIQQDASDVLLRTAKLVENVARLKSFERYSKEVEGNPPAYRYLAVDQVSTAGEKPFTKLSEHLYITGNTYVIASSQGPIMVIDPYGPEIVDRIIELQKKQSLGPIETVVISHAHNDHYTGAFQIPKRADWQLWTLDLVAKPIAEPFYYRAPYLDARSLKTDRILKDGQAVTWREYQFRIHHQPGQSYFSMGFQVVIDKRDCFFTADNFFHADQFTGSGGWSGRNRSWPSLYASSALQVLNSKPEWILAEHGGPFEFNEEDFRRRVRWGEAASKAADQISPNSNHRQDWDPHRIHVEPFLQRVTAGSTATAEIVVTNHLDQPETFSIELDGRNLVEAKLMRISVPAGQTVRQRFSIQVGKSLSPGRYIFPLIIKNGDVEDGADLFLVLETKE